MNPPGIQRLFDRYNDAFLARDAKRIAACYHVPCMTIRADGSFHIFESGAEIERFFATVSETYHEEGMRSFEMRDVEVRMIGSESALVSMEWFMKRADDTIIRNWRQSYNLLKQGDEWVFLLSTYLPHPNNADHRTGDCRRFPLRQCLFSGSGWRPTRPLFGRNKEFLVWARCSFAGSGRRPAGNTRSRKPLLLQRRLGRRQSCDRDPIGRARHVIHADPVAEFD